MHVAHEIKSQWDQEENAETPAGEANKDGLHGMRIQFQDVQRRNRKNRACHDRSGNSSNSSDDHVLLQAGPAPVQTRQTNGKNGNRNGRFHHLPDFQSRISRSDREDDAEEDAPANRPRRQFRHADVS